MNWITEKFKRFKPKIKNLFRVKLALKENYGKIVLVVLFCINKT